MFSNSLTMCFIKYVFKKITILEILMYTKMSKALFKISLALFGRSSLRKDALFKKGGKKACFI